MQKSKFQDNAKPPGKPVKTDQSSTTATVVTQPKPVAIGPRPPAPRAPFGMHVLPVAVAIRPIPTKAAAT